MIKKCFKCKQYFSLMGGDVLATAVGPKFICNACKRNVIEVRPK